MKRIWIILLLFTASVCKAQNLVPNPSFELYDTCPYELNQVRFCEGWFPARQSPDYFNTCAPHDYPVNVYIPRNFWGYQYPSDSGNAYTGFAAKYSVDFNGREYLGSQLLSPLIKETRYFVSFKVSLSIAGDATQYCGVNELGTLFSTVRYSVADGDTAPITNYAQVYTDSIITDTLKWITIRGSFISDSNYSYIYIGNFFSDSLTDSTQLAGFQCIAYYYLDEVCVSEDSAYAYNYPYTGINEFAMQHENIYPNPTNSFITIDNIKNDVVAIKLYDLTWRFMQEETANNTTPYRLDLNSLTPGTYNLLILRKNSLSSNHLIIKL